MSKEKEIEVKKKHKPSHHLVPQYERMVDRFFSDGPIDSPKSISHVRETDRSYLVSADVLGIPLEDIHIDLSGNMLRVRAESEEVNENESDANGFRSSFRSFHQSFALPTNVDVEHIEAHCDNGHLKITLPKTISEKPRRIDDQATKKSLEKH